MRFRRRQSGCRANGKEENPRRGKCMGQIREVIRTRLVSVRGAPDTSRHLMSVCQAVSPLEEIVGVLCSEAALRRGLFWPAHRPLSPYLRWEFLEAGTVSYLCSQSLMCCLELTSYDLKQNKTKTSLSHIPLDRRGGRWFSIC